MASSRGGATSKAKHYNKGAAKQLNPIASAGEQSEAITT